MNIILLQTRLSLEEMEHLLKEFPQYLFLSFNENTYKQLTPELWAKVEILFGNRLTVEELEMAPQLRWIHVPSTYLNSLCLEEIKQKGNILITTTENPNIKQVGEFVLGITLAFAKNLFHWKEENKEPQYLWDSKWRQTMWSLENRVLLQLGLNSVGREITKKCQQMNMKILGVDESPSFHPFCQKTFSFQQIHDLLPQADVICLTLPKEKSYENWLGVKELHLMKEDAILIIIGSHKVLSEEFLRNEQLKKLRGIVIDASYQTPIPPFSNLWKLPNVIITPDISSRPKINNPSLVPLFRFNLRQYFHGNFNDMKDLLPEFS